MKREKCEWVNIWWENADDNEKERVLLVGDSITNGYRRYVQEKLKEDFNVDMLATSKAIDDPAFFKELRYVLAEYPYTVIHFNNGLHGEHMTIKAYEAGLRKAARLMSARSGNVILASSTPLTVAGSEDCLHETTNPKVIERNATVARVAADLGLDFDDLYAASVGKPELRGGDGCHFNNAGSKELGDIVADSIFSIVERGLV